jgi:hypothetical protein
MWIQESNLEIDGSGKSPKSQQIGYQKVNFIILELLPFPNQGSWQVKQNFFEVHNMFQVLC